MADEGIWLLFETMERRRIHPSLLNKLKLAFKIGAQRHENHASFLLAPCFVVNPTPTKQAVTVCDTLFDDISGLLAVTRVGAPDVGSKGTSEAERIIFPKGEIVFGLAIQLPPRL